MPVAPPALALGVLPLPPISSSPAPPAPAPVLLPAPPAHVASWGWGVRDGGGVFVRVMLEMGVRIINMTVIMTLLLDDENVIRMTGKLRHYQLDVVAAAVLLTEL